MTIDSVMLSTLQTWAKAEALGKPYRLEFWVTGAGHIIADVWLTLYPFDLLTASSHIGWEDRNY
jgi:hypothetical protein